MPPAEMEDIFTKILTSGVTGGTLFAACWWLVRALKDQYEKRIEALEEAVQECGRDRADLHKQLEDHRNRSHQRIEELWKVIAAQGGAVTTAPKTPHPRKAKPKPVSE